MRKKTAKGTKERAIEAALRCAEENGWNKTNMRDISEKSGISMHELHEYFEDRYDILIAYGKMIDRKVLENITTAADDNTSPRDKLFDIMMERFDILNESREAEKALLEAVRTDPKQGLLFLPYLCKSMSWMLDASEIDTGGIQGAVKIAGLTGIYLNVLRTWANDNSEDMGKTMAALDKSLGHAEKWAGKLCPDS
jgi:AcrR family transcriptional regulator